MKNNFVASGIISAFSLGLAIVHSYILGSLSGGLLSNGAVAFVFNFLATVLAVGLSVLVYSRIFGLEISTVGSIVISGGTALAKAVFFAIFTLPAAIGWVVTLAITFAVVFVGLKVFGN